MDLTPPSLTRSPASPPNTYCPSERSSLEYPSPILVDQHYKIASLFSEDSCSMAQLDSEGSLPPLDSMTHHGWHSPAGMAPTSASSPIPNALSEEYDPFANYHSPLPGPYGHESYPPPPSHSPAMAHSPMSSVDAPTRSPIPSSRNSASYPVPISLAPRVKLEATGDYSSCNEVSHYPSPRSINAPYGPDSGPYSTQPSGYLSDNQAAVWPKSDYEADQFYQHASGQAAALSDSRRRLGMSLTRPRRPPRRLTTKEEANFQCDVKGCGKLFSRSYNFKAHMETHDEKREYPFPCTAGDCNKKFVRKTDLQRHHQSVHMKERNHKCDFCGRLFARKDTLRRSVTTCLLVYCMDRS
jgi:hypothetical protein